MKNLLSPRMATFVGLLAAAVACDDTPAKSSTPSSSTPKETAGTDDTSSSADCSDLKKSQGPSEPCCPTYGKDACGANLFCAAFDGRKTPTCYVEGQQTGGEECSDDSHCASNQCNADASKCVGVLGDGCESEAGCGEKSVCVAKKCVAADPAPQAPCDADDDCKKANDPMTCVRGRCGYPNGRESGVASFCSSRFGTKLNESSSFVTCAACTADSDCLATEGREKFEVCQKGICVHTCLNDAQCGSFVCKSGSCAGDAAYTCVDKFCR